MNQPDRSYDAQDARDCAAELRAQTQEWRYIRPCYYCRRLREHATDCPLAPEQEDDE